MSAAIRIVLVDTSHPGNIGACARAMKNMGLSTLVLVRPALYPHPEAIARAAGAADLLAGARVEATIDAAIEDCGLVFGASARPRSVNWRVLAPRAAAAELLAGGGARPAAVLFGDEQNGLSNEELARCQALIRIPADPAYDSLNLAQAVQIVCYEILVAARAARGPESAPLPASVKEMTALHEHLDAVLTRVGYLQDRNAAQLAPRIRRLLARAVPDAGEVRILRGLLAAIERQVSQKDTGR